MAHREENHYHCMRIDSRLPAYGCWPLSMRDSSYISIFIYKYKSVAAGCGIRRRIYVRYDAAARSNYSSLRRHLCKLRALQNEKSSLSALVAPALLPIVVERGFLQRHNRLIAIYFKLALLIIREVSKGGLSLCIGSK